MLLRELTCRCADEISLRLTFLHRRAQRLPRSIMVDVAASGFPFPALIKQALCLSTRAGDVNAPPSCRKPCVRHRVSRGFLPQALGAIYVSSRAVIDNGSASAARGSTLNVYIFSTSWGSGVGIAPSRDAIMSLGKRRHGLSAKLACWHGDRPFPALFDMTAVFASLCAARNIKLSSYINEV